MPARSSYKGLDKLALTLLGLKSINNVADVDRGVLSAVLQYWTNQVNTSLIFCTILSTLAIALLTDSQEPICLKLLSLPLFASAFWFGVRAWAFGRCARIVSFIWL